MHFDELLEKAKQCAQTGEHMAIPSSWGQGRTVFGGLSASLLYTVMQSKVNGERVLRSLNTNFVGPLLVDVPFTFEVEVLREGKSVSQMSARLIQNGSGCCFSARMFWGRSRLEY